MGTIGTMDTIRSRDALQAARELVAQVEAFLARLPVNREKFSVRLNRCEGSEGGQRDDIYHVWVGLQATARGNDAGDVLEGVHAHWQQAGWDITRHRRLPNGGVNVAAVEPGTGNSYALDSGFDKGPDRYVVGFFNTPCYQDPSGAVGFGEIRGGLGSAPPA